MVFNFLTAVAEEQSRSISENTVWGLEKLAEKGIRHIGCNRVLGYDEIDGVLVPNEQAWIPELIYALYAADKPMREIIKTLKEKNAKRLRSDTPFDQRTIEQILENEIYVGDRQIQKGPHRDFKTGKPKVHEDYVSYFVTDGHEGIVSREVWDKAQERLKMERERKDKKIYRKHNSHFLYGRLMCGECGEWMTRKSNIGRKGMSVKNWYCRDRVKGKRGNGCKNLIIPEEEILQALAEFLGHEWTRIENVDESIYENIKVARVFADGTISVDLIN